MISVLQVVGRMNRGGAETFVMNLLRSIDRTRFRFVFLCYFEGEYDFEKEIESLGGVIVRIKDDRVRNPFRFIRNIQNIVRQYDIDVVHSHVDYSTGYAMIAGSREGVKLRIAHSHNTRATKSPNPLRKFFPVLMRVVINTYATKRLACEQAAGRALFYRDKPFIVVKNGINVDAYRYNDGYRSEIRDQLGIGADQMVMLHVGRFAQQKNHIQLLDIFSDYARSRPGAVLVLLGDGDLRPDIERHIEELGLDESVHVLGVRGQTEKYYSAADLFILPSLYEGLPVSLIEAQASGLECVTSDTTDTNSNMGLVHFVSLSRPDEWVRLMHELSVVGRVEDKVVYKRLKGEYDIAAIARQVEGLYGEVGRGE